MIVHPVWFGTVFAGAFVFLRSRETVPPGWRGGAAYGVAVFLAGALPIYAIVFASLAIPPAVIGFWMIHSLCQYAAAGAALGLVDDRQTLCKTNLG